MNVCVPPSALLAGRLVLLAEDDALAPSSTEEALREAGVSILLAHDAYQAMLVASGHRLNAAILDAHRGEHTIACVGACLKLHEVPFLLIAGRDHRNRPGVQGGRACVLIKPVETQMLIAALATILTAVSPPPQMARRPAR